MANANSSSQLISPDSTHPARGTTALCFMLILLLGAVIRFQHLTAESVWWDEFATVAFLDPPEPWTQSPHYRQWNQQVERLDRPTLKQFLQQNQLVDPAAMPLYLVLEFAWNRYVHASPAALRILSVCVGLLLLPLIYLIGSRLYDRRAGLIAMACLSLSPIHVQFAKEIRMYGLLALLALITVYAFIRALEEGKKRWWFLGLTATCLLSWTHPFALLLLFVQGLFWLLTRPRDIVRLTLWSLAVCLAVMPAVYYVATIQFWGQDSTDQWLRLPTVMEVAADIFADDAVGATFQLKESPVAFAKIFGASLAEQLVQRRLLIAYLFLFTSAGTALFLCFRTLRQFFKKQADTAEDKRGRSAGRWNYFLLLWLIVPPLVLYLLSLAWRPCHQPRYTLHASLALYLIYGGAITAISQKYLRRIALAALMLFYGFQQMLVIGEPQHPDWLGAAAHIRKEARGDDLILSFNSMWKRVFTYNLGPVSNVISYGADSEILADQAAFFLQLGILSRDDDKPRDVWIVVLTDYYESGPDQELNRALHRRQLPFTMCEFGGIQHVLLYHVRGGTEALAPYTPHPGLSEEAAEDYTFMATEFWKQQEFAVAAAAAENAARINPEYAQAYALAGMSYKESGNMDKALAAFDRAIALDPDGFPWNHLNRADLLLKKGDYERARVAAEKGLALLPEDSLGLILKGRACIGLGLLEEARNLLQAARAKGPDGRLIEEAFQELENAGEAAP